MQDYVQFLYNFSKKNPLNKKLYLDSLLVNSKSLNNNKALRNFLFDIAAQYYFQNENNVREVVCNALSLEGEPVESIIEIVSISFIVLKVFMR